MTNNGRFRPFFLSLMTDLNVIVFFQRGERASIIFAMLDNSGFLYMSNRFFSVGKQKFFRM
jgi:hypothetical protein